MTQFRFENLEIWKVGSQISDELYDIADALREKKKFRFAEQLDGATLSITNNISEGSGSFSNKDFANFINISRRSVFECANIIATVERRGYIDNNTKEEIYNNLLKLSKMLTNFRKSLLK